MSTHHNTIFISYRRSESQLHTLALYHRLQQEYRDQVFMDQQTMKVGENFRLRIEGQLQGCRVLLAVIGPGWASERLQNPRDWVRLEITTALKRGIAVIPVLIDGAQMPGEAELPEDLHALLDVHALDLDHRRYFEQGVALLLEALREILDTPTPLHSRESGNPRTEPTVPVVDPRLRGDDGKGGGDGADWWKRQIPWAKAYGEKGSDEFDTPWADIEIGGAVQRMRWIKPGSFLMGCDPGDSGGYDDEKPQHRVTLTKGFWLADTACTQGLWQTVTGQNPSHFKGSADLPVESVSWDDVTGLFLPKLTQRLGVSAELSTEAQWEYACRAGGQTPYWFGDSVTPAQVNFDGTVGRTVPVKERPANGWGLYQMHGNVWEWCAGSNRQYSAAALENPPDGQDQNSRALRGGSWHVPARDTRSADRRVHPRVSSSRRYGFRFSLRSIKPGQSGGA
ncbi:SUMF1/EgtB/PvdO family nonheme iron enzyme [uncultured Sphaerotilus sp.]|uniref:SUMF1/EgtB/PvdO family nonheme iron enzyme n=1 Tax=uncultured Sphaerotilus sp. TaxID=474984 RepID=UPI0030CA3967